MTEKESSNPIRQETRSIRLIQEARINLHNGHKIQFPSYSLELQVSPYL